MTVQPFSDQHHTMFSDGVLISSLVVSSSPNRSQMATNAKVCERIKELIQDWDYDLGSSISQFHSRYESLRREGFEFPPKKKPSAAASHPAPKPQVHKAPMSREEEEMAIAIELSLKEQQQQPHRQQQQQRAAAIPPASRPPPKVCIVFNL